MSQSLIRAIKLLDCFEKKPELSLHELVEIAEMPKTTVFRLVASLEETGLIVKTKYSSHEVKYKLGLKLLELGELVQNQLDYRSIAVPYMKELNEKLNETVHLAVVENNYAVYIEKFDSRRPIRLVIRIGARVPLYAGSASKALFAHLDEVKREAYLEKIEFKKLAQNTIVEREAIEKELDKIRVQGYAFSNEEVYEDTVGFSCPIKNNMGETIASLGVSIPKNDFNVEKEKKVLEEILEKSKAISKELGYKVDSEISI